VERALLLDVLVEVRVGRVGGLEAAGLAGAHVLAADVFAGGADDGPLV
jgi:hypothetical protein